MDNLCACGAVVNEEEVYASFQALFDAMAAGVLDELTPVEESIYYLSLCVGCAQRFLVDEQGGTA